MVLAGILIGASELIQRSGFSEGEVLGGRIEHTCPQVRLRGG
jgi:hypothetical protein